MKKETKKVFNNYIYLLAIQISNIVLPLISFPYLVRVLESEKYGLVMIAQSIAIFFTIIVDFGFNISATREVAKIKSDKNRLSEYFWNIFFIKLILLTICFFLLLILTIQINKLSLDPAIYLLSFGLVVGQAIFPTWFFQGIEKMQVITVINVMAKLFFTIAIFFFILSPDDYLYVPILNGLGFIIAGLFGLLYSLKFINFKTPNIKQVLGIVKESFALLISNLAVSLYTASNTIVLGFIAGDSLAGVYASMEKLVAATKSVFTPLYQALLPNIARKKKLLVKQSVKKMILPLAISGLLVSIIIIFNSKLILNLVFDDEFITSYYKVFQILGLIALFSSINMLFVSLYFPSIKQYNLRLKILSVSGILHIITVIILGYFYSIYGVAIGAVFTEVIILIYAFKKFKIIE